MSHELVLKKDLTNLYGLVSPAEAAKVISFALPVFGTLFLTGQFGWLTAINATIGILGVLQVFRSSSNPWVKTGWAMGVAALQALSLIVTDATGFAAVTRNDWWTVIGAAFGAVGVLVVPNKIIAAHEPISNVTVNVAADTGPVSRP